MKYLNKMERILVSQHEENNGTDYVILNGNLLKDSTEVMQYAKKVIDVDDFRIMYSDEYLTISQKENKILFSSHYENRDNAGRKIYYLYLIDKQDNLETILDYLEKDSMALQRNFDREKTLEIIQKIKNNSTLKNNLTQWILLGIAVLGAVYLISKIAGNNE